MTELERVFEIVKIACEYVNTLEFDVTDSGHANVSGDYDLSCELADAVDSYKELLGIPLTESRKLQRAKMNFANLVRGN